MARNDSSNTLGTLLTGMLAGAAIAVLSDSDRRKQLKNNLKSALDKGDQKLDQLEDKASEVKDKAQEKGGQVKDKAKRKISRKLSQAERRAQRASS